MAQKCSCLKGTYDFLITQTRCGEVTYLDRSEWQTGAEFVSAPEFQLSIKFPDGSTRTYDGTVGTPIDLNLGECVEPGVYTASVTSCLDTYSKKFAITCSLWCGFLKSVAKVGYTDHIRDIKERIERAEISAATDFVTAISLIKSVKRDLERIDCSCGC